jgi:predicted HD superfamily hydrolase involved in NAD metabolism
MSLYQDYLEAYALKPHRKIHIEGVVSLSVSLARRYGLNLDDMENAAYLHDLTKYETDLFHQSIFKKYDREDYLEFPSFLYHGFSAGLLGKHLYHQNDEVIDAVSFHVIGRPEMTLFEKILMLSDKIEPSRDFEGIDVIREKAFINFDAAFKQFLTHKYHYDVSNHLLNPYSLKTYRYYIKEIL